LGVLKFTSLKTGYLGPFGLGSHSVKICFIPCVGAGDLSGASLGETLYIKNFQKTSLSFSEIENGKVAFTDFFNCGKPCLASVGLLNLVGQKYSLPRNMRLVVWKPPSGIIALK